MGLLDFSFDIALVVANYCLNFAYLFIVVLVKLIEFKRLRISNVSDLSRQIFPQTLYLRRHFIDQVSIAIQPVPNLSQAHLVLVQRVCVLVQAITVLTQDVFVLFL